MLIINNILKFIIFVFITFYACEVITDRKKRISYLGTILICFSSAIVQYINDGLLEAILCGELIFISLDKLLTNSKNIYLYCISVPVRNIRFLVAF